jgi:membrane protein required for colicin V production
MNLTFLDYFVIVVLSISVITGALRGLVKGAISMASTIVGFIAAAYMYPYAASVLGIVVSNEVAAKLLGFVLIFFAFVLAGAFLARWIRRGLKRVKLGWADHMLGALFGLVRAWLICSTVYLALTAFPIRIKSVEQATMAPFLLEGTRAIASLTSGELREQFFGGYRSVKRLWDHTAGSQRPGKNQLRPQGEDALRVIAN